MCTSKSALVSTISPSRSRIARASAILFDRFTRMTLSGKAGDCGRIVEHLPAQCLAEQLGQAWISLVQPTPKRDAVRHIYDAARIESREAAEQSLGQQVGVQYRHSIGAVRTNKGEVAHPDAPPVFFVDQRECCGYLFTDRTYALCHRQMVVVDLIDDLQMARQDALEQWDGPAFEGLWQQGVIGVGAGGDGDFPGLVPRDVMQIDKDAHQFGDGDARVRIVELNGGVVGQGVNGAI